MRPTPVLQTSLHLQCRSSSISTSSSPCAAKSGFLFKSPLNRRYTCQPTLKSAHRVLRWSIPPLPFPGNHILVLAGVLTQSLSKLYTHVDRYVPIDFAQLLARDAFCSAPLSSPCSLGIFPSTWGRLPYSLPSCSVFRSMTDYERIHFTSTLSSDNCAISGLLLCQVLVQ